MVVKQLFAFLLVFSGLMFYGAFGAGFINQRYIPVLIIIAVATAVVSAGGLLIIVIRERFKDKKEEEESDVFNKY